MNFLKKISRVLVVGLLLVQVQVAQTMAPVVHASDPSVGLAMQQRSEQWRQRSLRPIRINRTQGLVGMCILPVLVPDLFLFSLFSIYNLASAARQNDPSDRNNLRPLSQEVTSYMRSVSKKAVMLITNRSNIDQLDSRGYTVLMQTSEMNYPELVRLCIMRGADMDFISRDGKNSLMCAIDANDIESVRALLATGLNVQTAKRYLIDQIALIQNRIVEHEGEVQQINADAGLLNMLTAQREDLVVLQKMETLFSQTHAQLLAPLTLAQKAEYKKMFAGREKIKPSLHGSLILYEHFDDATALKKYLKVNSQIHQGIANKRNGLQDVMPHIMSFLREKPEATRVRLDDALCKARLENNQELSALLQANGAALDENKFYDAHINKQFWQ